MNAESKIRRRAMAAWAKAMAPFEAVLIELQEKGVTNPFPQTETNLFDALGGLTPERFAETDATLDRIGQKSNRE